MQSIESAARLLSRAETIVVFTGAGMSHESGIATFRDALTGIWSRFNPEELATERAFRADPRRVFSWYVERLTRVREVEPNDGHYAVAEMEGRFPSVVVVTQNVDGLHRRAGSSTVFELHGSLESFRCIECGAPHTGDEVLRRAGPLKDEMVDPLPCESCGGYVRPGVVWFGEMLPERETEEAWRAARGCDAMLVVGTSAVVYPAAELPFVARAAGASLIEVNPDATPISEMCDSVVRSTAAQALPAILESLTIEGPA